MKDILKRIGLTDGEINIYLSLLEIGSSATGAIIKKSRISGSKVYEVLDRLESKGLANHTIKNRVKYFEASQPAKILDYLEERKSGIDNDKQEIMKILPQLMIKRATAPKSEAKIFTGWEGMKTVNQDIIDSLKKGEEWLEMGLTQQPKSWERYFNHKQKERSRKGIIHKSIINSNYKSLFENRKKLPHTIYRFLPKELEMPISTNIFKNKVAIFVLIAEDPITIVLESDAIASSFRKYFKVLWDYAKPR